MSKDYEKFYRSLGVEAGCSWTELKLAYRRLVRVWHPDQRLSTDANSDDRIKEVNTAYRTLADYYRRHGVLPEVLEEIEPSPEGVYSTPPATPTGSHVKPHSTQRRFRWRSAPLLILLGLGLAMVYSLVDNTENTHTPESTTTSDSTSSSNPSPTQVVSEENDRPFLKKPKRSRFMPGSTVGEVIAAQGPPTRVDGDIWYYGASKVYFQNGRVTHWDDADTDPLNVQLAKAPTLDSDVRFFAKGSTKSQVRAAQGSPLFETDVMWDYGASRVYFKDGRVSGWDESPVRPLHIRR